MDLVGDSLRKTATGNMWWLPTGPIDFLQPGELADTLDLAHLAEIYDFDAAPLERRSFHGIQELQSPLSDY